MASGLGSMQSMNMVTKVCDSAVVARALMQKARESGINIVVVHKGVGNLGIALRREAKAFGVRYVVRHIDPSSQVAGLLRPGDEMAEVNGKKVVDSRQAAKWIRQTDGALMLRVIDDVAALLQMRHVFLADESSVWLSVWDARSRGAKSAQVMLKYLHPLVHGTGYYEPHGYYTIDAGEYYGSGFRGSVDKSRRCAAADLNAFDTLRQTPFRAGELARAIAKL